MSKMLVYVLDKFVWLLLIAVLTTQALQIAGVVETPKESSLADITYTNGNEYEYRMSLGESDIRGKRQAGDRSPLIDNLFNIPIATLNAVNDLVQSSRPAFRRFREAAQRRFEGNSNLSSKGDSDTDASQVGENTQRQQRAYQKSEDGPEVQPDGSSSRVLLKV